VQAPHGLHRDLDALARLRRADEQHQVLAFADAVAAPHRGPPRRVRRRHEARRDAVRHHRDASLRHAEARSDVRRRMARHADDPIRRARRVTQVDDQLQALREREGLRLDQHREVVDRDDSRRRARERQQRQRVLGAVVDVGTDAAQPHGYRDVVPPRLAPRRRQRDLLDAHRRVERREQVGAIGEHDQLERRVAEGCERAHQLDGVRRGTARHARDRADRDPERRQAGSPGAATGPPRHASATPSRTPRHIAATTSRRPRAA
jgi:hypothetical protein